MMLLTVEASRFIQEVTGIVRGGQVKEGEALDHLTSEQIRYVSSIGMKHLYRISLRLSM